MENAKRVVIPTCMRQEILIVIQMGHLGTDKFHMREQQSVFWSGIDSGIDQIVSTFEECQLTQ